MHRATGMASGADAALVPLQAHEPAKKSPGEPGLGSAVMGAYLVAGSLPSDSCSALAGSSEP